MGQFEGSRNSIAATLLAGLTAAGCGAEKTSAPEAVLPAIALADRSPLRVVLQQGDPSQGKVTLYGQVHTVGQESKAELEEIGLYQAAILQTLLLDKPKHLVCEARVETLYPGSVSRNQELATDLAVNLFSDGIKTDWNNLSSDQLRWLSAFGAAGVYATLQPDVTLHAYASAAFEENLWHQIESANAAGAPTSSMVFDVRDEACRNSVNEVLNKNPGEQVGVIFGRDHINILQGMAHGNNGPQLELVDWPQLQNSRSTVIGDRMYSETNPLEQLKIISQMRFVPVAMWSLLETEDVRRAAYPKLEVTGLCKRLYAEPGGVRDMLILFATSEPLKLQVQRDYSAKVGVFASDD